MEQIQQTQTVVAGEASESDEDEVDTSPPVVSTGTERSGDDPKTVNSGQPVSSGVPSSVSSGVVVSGEASESEEEEIDTSQPEIPPLNVNQSVAGDREDITHTAPLSPVQTQHKPKYNSLLNRKLRERNTALRRHLVETIHQSYTTAGKDLHTITLHTQKTQIAIQDVTHLLRNTTNDLFNLEDKVDIVRSCNLLPDFNMQLLTNQNIPTAEMKI